MADQDLKKITTALKSQSLSLHDGETSRLLRDAKRRLLQLNALTPATITDPSLLTLARETYEQGALASIRAKDSDSFTRYVAQLSPFYELPVNNGTGTEQRNKVTGLFLLLLLTQGLYDKFHSELEALTTREGSSRGSVDIETDPYLGYPIRLERWLMEGSYDRVWKAMKKGEVPCEEYSVFSDVSFSSLTICS